MLAIMLFLAAEAYASAVITRMSDRQILPLSQLVNDLERSDLILIGEAHDNRQHHEMQLALIRALWAKRAPLAIGVEVIQSDSQQLLDDWTAGKVSEQSFQVGYTRNWSMDWTLYRDIFIFARDNRIPMIALNVPQEIVSKVSRQGFASLTPAERKDLPQGTTCDLNNPHTAFLRSSFKKVFNHVANGSIFTYFCEAQAVRNSGMAINIARYQKSHPGTRIVALAGVWHAVKNAIPEQLERNGSKQSFRVVLPELPELNSDNSTAEVTDYMIGP